MTLSTTLLIQGSKEIGRISGAREINTEIWNMIDYEGFPCLWKIAEFKNRIYKFSNIYDAVRRKGFQNSTRGFIVPRSHFFF